LRLANTEAADMTRAVILADVSGSMGFPVSLDKRRIDVLRTTLAAILPSVPDACLVAFNDNVFLLEPGQPLPEPAGNTALHLALERARTMWCDHVIVIADGEPDDKQAAIKVALALDCRISTYYCGEEGNRAATSFLKTLALCSRHGVGRAMLGDLRKPEKLAGELRLLLAGPAR
jgi:hypothetical protein